MQRILGAACAITLLFAAPATAQMRWQHKAFVDVGLGFQPSSREVNSEAQVPLYDETAIFASTQKIGGGPVFDVSGGYRVWRNLTVGMGYSWFGDTVVGTATATVPHPLFFDSPRTASTDISGLGHTEHSLHFTATWMVPVTDKIDVGIFAGPSVFFLRQDLVLEIPFSEGSPPFSSITLGEALAGKLKGTALGVNVGVQGTYMITGRFGGRFGVNGFLRFAGAQVDSDALQTGNLEVGGFQLGFGVRTRF